MKLKINIEFRDKFNGTIYEKDSIVEFGDERAKELLADKRKLVSEVKEAAPELEKQDEKKSEDVKPKKKKK